MGVIECRYADAVKLAGHSVVDRRRRLSALSRLLATTLTNYLKEEGRSISGIPGRG